MSTSSEQPVADFRTLFASAQRSVRHGPAGVHELDLKLDSPTLRARSRLLTSGGLLFVRGENHAHLDLVLRHEGAAPLVALHAPLRGSVHSRMSGVSLSDTLGALQLFAAPDSCATVRMQAHVTNAAFRISIDPALIEALAARHPQLEPLASCVASGRPYTRTPIQNFPARELIAEAREIMNSERYGALRPLFLESRALGWLARSLAEPAEASEPPLRKRELDRMHQVRAILLTRLSDPPTLAELSKAVGTNDFALKRNFKAVFGQPVHAYLLSLRLKHACELLEEGVKTIPEIAAAVGYAHPNHFYTAFRRAYGTTPLRYRRKVGA